MTIEPTKSKITFMAKNAVVPKAALRGILESQFAAIGITAMRVDTPVTQSERGRGTVTVTGSLTG